MENSLVSIISPCYNADLYIHRMLESVLAQDYSNIELIVVDDGSTDKTLDILETFKSKFQEKKFLFTILKQPNSGQSVATNNALKHVRGEYLSWIDSDDYYASSQSISCMVDAMKKQDSDVGIIRGLLKKYDSLSFDFIMETNYQNYGIKENLFEPCLFGTNDFNYTPGQFLIRMNAFDRCVPNRSIYTERFAAQNWQLLLPILYNYKCVTIRDVVLHVLYRKGSQSQGAFSTHDKRIIKETAYYNTTTNTIKSIQQLSQSEKDVFLNKLYVKYHYILFKTHVGHCYSEEAFKELDILKKCGWTISIGWRFRYYLCHVPALFKCYKGLTSIIPH